MPKLKQTEIDVLDEAFEQMRGRGYVLDFSDRTFPRYFDEEFAIDIYDERYAPAGLSKGRRLKAFLDVVDGNMAARVLRSLWDYRAGILDKQGATDTSKLSDRYFKIVHRLEGETVTASTDAIERFIPNETLDELVAAIQRDITANKPQAALDRLHTYCMKKFAHLLQGFGESCGQDDPLHSRVGRYVKILEAGGGIQGISLKIMKSSISIFDDFNHIRNNKSFAHDNEIIGLHEARFIFDSISSILRYTRSLETNRFGE